MNRPWMGVAVAMACLLGGCATGSSVQFTSLKGQSDAQLDADRKDCDLEAQKDVNIFLRGGMIGSNQTLDKFKECMKARGYEAKS